MYLLRKISRSKWEPRGGVDMGEIPADAVTVDLRTSGNALSTWRCGEGGEEGVAEAVLALVAGYERLERIDVVWLAEEDLGDDGLALRETAGRTPVTSLVGRHVDIWGLDLERLGRLARRVMEAIAAGRCKRLRKSEVLEVLATAVKKGRVSLGDLKDRVRDEVAAAVEQAGE